jgi:hypothetical protein
MALIADDRREADLAHDALAGLDRLLAALPHASSLPAGEIAALVHLIHAAARGDVRSRDD